MRVSNFLFHRVSPERDPLWDPMDPRLFERVMAYLDGRFRVVLLEELARSPERFAAVDGRPVCTIGFDDGYKDNVTHALPVLKRFGFPASFYVVTDCIDQGRPTWTYELDHALMQAGIPLEQARALKARLKALPHDARTRELDALRERHGSDVPRGMMMSWDDVRELVKEGFTVGSHSKTHSMLGTMSDRAAIREELRLSRDVIEREMGVTPLAISYPIGSSSPLVEEEAEAAGYRIGLLTGQKSLVLDESFHPFRIPRLELYNESWLKTRLRIDGAVERVKAWMGR